MTAWSILSTGSPASVTAGALPIDRDKSSKTLGSCDLSSFTDGMTVSKPELEAEGASQTTKRWAR